MCRTCALPELRVLIWQRHQLTEQLDVMDPSMAEVTVTFDAPGPLGLELAERQGGGVELLSLQRGSQGERHADRLQPGMLLAAVGGVSSIGKGYDDVLKLVQRRDRPLKLQFAWPPGSVEVRFESQALLACCSRPCECIVLDELVQDQAQRHEECCARAWCSAGWRLSSGW